MQEVYVLVDNDHKFINVFKFKPKALHEAKMLGFSVENVLTWRLRT